MVSAEALHIRPPPIHSSGGVLTRVDSQLLPPEGVTPQDSAILLKKGHLFADQVAASGFAEALKAVDVPAGEVEGNRLEKDTSHGMEAAPSQATLQFLRRPAPHERERPYPTDPAKWVSVAKLEPSRMIKLMTPQLFKSH